MSHLRKKCGIISKGILVLVLIPTPAQACSICVMAFADQLLPPVMLWFAYSVAAFLMLAIVGRVTKGKIALIPTPGKAFLLAFGAVIIGMAFLSPLPSLLLGVVAVMASGIVLVYPRATPAWGLRRLTAGAVLVGFVTLGSYSVSLQYTRDPVDFIIMWENTVPGQAAFTKLGEAPEDHLPGFRRIAAEGTGESALQSARYLIEFGTRSDAEEIANRLEEWERDMPSYVQQDWEAMKRQVQERLEELHHKTDDAAAAGDSDANTGNNHRPTE